LQEKLSGVGGRVEGKAEDGTNVLQEFDFDVSLTI